MNLQIFSFMQQYFPGLFPSQFAARRQELLQRYEVRQNDQGTGREVLERLLII